MVFHLSADTAAALSGWVGCAATREGVCAVTLPRRSCAEALQALAPGTGWVLSWSPLLCRAHRQIAEFLRGRRCDFALPLDLSNAGDFALEVLLRLRRIAYGRTCSYGELAAAVGRPGASRAVGRVMAANPVPLVLPCHRVIGQGGGLVGFAGGIWQKSALLALEAATSPRHGGAPPPMAGFHVG